MLLMKRVHALRICRISYILYLSRLQILSLWNKVVYWQYLISVLEGEVHTLLLTHSNIKRNQ